MATMALFMAAGRESALANQKEWNKTGYAMNPNFSDVKDLRITQGIPSNLYSEKTNCARLKNIIQAASNALQRQWAMAKREGSEISFVTFCIGLVITSLV